MWKKILTALVSGCLAVLIVDVAIAYYLFHFHAGLDDFSALYGVIRRRLVLPPIAEVASNVPIVISDSRILTWRSRRSLASS